MKLVLIIGLIAECLILIVLSLLKRLTKRAFIIIAIVTTIGCAVVGFYGKTVEIRNDQVDQRAHLYMATRLIEEKYYSETLEVLSDVTDEDCAQYGSRTIRVLSYNLNEAYRTAESYLHANEIGELDQLVLDACHHAELVDDDTQKSITSSVLTSIAATDSETAQWEIEMKVRFMGFRISDEEKDEVTDKLGVIKLAVLDNQYEDAYNYAVSGFDDNDIKTAILISNMYVNNYNQRIMADTDYEYSQLWKEASDIRADLNIMSLSARQEDASEKDNQNYELLKARYDMALNALNEESVKRAINFLQSISTQNPTYQMGYELQLARLYFLSNQFDEAREHIYNIFSSSKPDESVWLGRDLDAFREAYIRYISDQTDYEYSVLFDNLIKSLYQSVFDGENYNSFKEFVIAYLRDVFGGIVIKRVNTTAFPVISVEVSTSRSDVEVGEQSISVNDTGEDINSFSVSLSEVNDLSLSLILDRSGSMEGDNLVESKRAIRSCVSQMADSVSYSFVTFENTARLECALTDSKYLVMNLVEGITTTGGTNISSGLSLAIESLMPATGTKVIILLSDGHDFDESKQIIDSVLVEANANNITVYTIGLQGCDEEYLQKIATSTGGQFIMVTDLTTLERTYQEIQNAMMNNYTISYEVSDEAEARSVIIKESGSLVEARKNYSLHAEDNSISTTYGNGTQEAGYYKQIGGTDIGG